MMIREFATKRLTSLSRTHLHIDTMLSKGISRTHSYFRPHISHTSNCYGHRCFALKVASSAPASELRLETASLNSIAASRKAASGKLKLDPMDTFLTPNTVPDAQAVDQLPTYSYKHYKPLPTVVYTEHEQEANDLIAGLKPGYVFQ